MKISVLGAGLLGSALTERLLALKYEVCVYNRTAWKAEILSAKGACNAATVREAVEYGDCVILMLTDFKAIEELLLKDNMADFQGKTIIQMGTVAPAQSKELLEKIKKLNGDYFECPVLGSRKEVLAGNLILMVGGTGEQFEKNAGFLKKLGSELHFVGGTGQASAMKLALNNLIAAHAVCFSLSLGIIEKRGINVEQFMDVLRPSALYAPMFDKKLPNWLKKNYSNPNFPVKHLLKDVELVLEEAQDNDLETGAVEIFAEIFRKAVKQNLGDLDYSAVYNTVTKKTDDF